MSFIVDIFTAGQARKAQEKAANKSIAASKDATDKSLALQQQMFNTIWQGTAVQRQAGDAATQQAMRMLGLSSPQSQQAPQGQYQQQGATNMGQPVLTSGRVGTGANLTARLAANGMEDRFSAPTPNALAPRPGQVTTRPVGQPVAMPTAAPAQPGAPAAAPAGQSPTDILRSTPGYQFNFNEGMRALNTGLAGQGRLQSGDAQREAIQFGQNYGDRVYGDYMNRLNALSGAGQVATSTGSGAAQNYANNGQQAYQRNALNLGSSYGQQADAQAGFWGSVNGAMNGGNIMQQMKQAGNIFGKIF